MKLTDAELAAMLARGEVRVVGDRGARSLSDSAETEQAFLARVLALAKQLGYRTYHTHRSDRSTPGWFDLAMARAGDKLVLAEVKRAGGKQTEAQRNWYEDLKRIERVETFLWYPTDFEHIVHILTQKGTTS